MKDDSKRPGHRAPAGYDASKYQRPAVAADIVIISFRQDRLEALLIERRHDPYQGCWALPGGFVDIDESLEAAALREVEEETGVSGLSLVPLGAYGDPGRDPRTRVISAAFLALVRADAIKPRAGDDAKEVAWFPLADLPELAFDHHQIVADARERLRELAVMTPRLLDLLPQVFAAQDFLKLCRELMGREFDEKVFAAAISHTPGFIPETANHADRLYRFDRAQYHMGDFMFLLLGERGR